MARPKKIIETNDSIGNVNTTVSGVGFGMSRTDKGINVDKVTYKYDGTCTVEVVYTTLDNLDAFDRYKILSAQTYRRD